MCERALVSVVGDDFSQEELTRMENAGMLVEGIERKEGEKSFFWSGSYHTDMNGRDTLETELNVLADFKPVIPAQWKGAQWLMLGNIDPSLQASVLDQLEQRPQIGGVGYHELLDGHRHGAPEGCHCQGGCFDDQR